MATPSLAASRVDAAGALAATAPILWMCAHLARSIHARHARAADPATAPLVPENSKAPVALAGL